MAAEALDPFLFGPEQRCFGCGPHNEHGLRMRFFREGDEVWSELAPRDGHEGPPGILHGGLQTTLLDEVAVWTLIGLRQKMGLTFSLQARLLRPVRMDQPVIARGRIEAEAERTATVRASLEQEGRRVAAAKVVLALLDEAGAERALGRPLPEAWRRFARGG